MYFYSLEIIVNNNITSSETGQAEIPKINKGWLNLLVFEFWFLEIDITRNMLTEKPHFNYYNLYKLKTIVTLETGNNNSPFYFQV